MNALIVTISQAIESFEKENKTIVNLTQLTNDIERLQGIEKYASCTKEQLMTAINRENTLIGGKVSKLASSIKKEELRDILAALFTQRLTITSTATSPSSSEEETPKKSDVSPVKQKKTASDDEPAELLTSVKQKKTVSKESSDDEPAELPVPVKQKKTVSKK